VVEQVPPLERVVVDQDRDRAPEDQELEQGQHQEWSPRREVVGSGGRLESSWVPVVVGLDEEGQMTLLLHEADAPYPNEGWIEMRLLPHHLSDRKAEPDEAVQVI